MSAQKKQGAQKRDAATVFLMAASYNCICSVITAVMNYWHAWIINRQTEIMFQELALCLSPAETQQTVTLCLTEGSISDDHRLSYSWSVCVSPSIRELRQRAGPVVCAVITKRALSDTQPQNCSVFSLTNWTKCHHRDRFPLSFNGTLPSEI